MVTLVVPVVMTVRNNRVLSNFSAHCLHSGRKLPAIILLRTVSVPWMVARDSIEKWWWIMRHSMAVLWKSHCASVRLESWHSHRSPTIYLLRLFQQFGNECRYWVPNVWSKINRNNNKTTRSSDFHKQNIFLKFVRYVPTLALVSQPRDLTTKNVERLHLETTRNWF